MMTLCTVLKMNWCPLLSHHNDNYLFDLYSYATEIKDIELQERSKMFLDIVINVHRKNTISG
jgi:hypothetical protein